ncbi:MAG: hypothetical protein M3O22_02275 [Pseudomonadota bacterium]|nr:hypothetical protein [Pseudomonadota bacterium]
MSQDYRVATLTVSPAASGELLKAGAREESPAEPWQAALTIIHACGDFLEESPAEPWQAAFRAFLQTDPRRQIVVCRAGKNVQIHFEYTMSRQRLAPRVHGQAWEGASSAVRPLIGQLSKIRYYEAEESCISQQDGHPITRYRIEDGRMVTVRLSP